VSGNELQAIASLTVKAQWPNVLSKANYYKLNMYDILVPSNCRNTGMTAAHQQIAEYQNHIIFCRLNLH